jgi:aryl-alcohol dehydrogenase-like predicted oxidoreductase
VTPAPFPRPSRIGFGCASLGSRVGAKAGIAALNRAFDHGINWFDLAPSYGDGLAESIFSRFSRGRRSEILISTKFGISPPRIGFAASALRPIARGILSYAPSFRHAVSKGRPRATKNPLTLGSITEGVERSLRRLGTDYVDVLALHDPEPQEFENDDLRDALQNILASGKARAIGIAGSLAAAISALRLDLPISYVQVANNPLQPQIDPLARAIEGAEKECFVITHSGFGQKGGIQRIISLIESYPDLKTMVLKHYNLSFEHSIRAALVDYSLLTNHSGAVLFSMFSQKNLEFNLRRLNSSPPPDTKSFLENLRAITTNRPDSDEQQVL